MRRNLHTIHAIPYFFGTRHAKHRRAASSRNTRPHIQIDATNAHTISNCWLSPLAWNNILLCTPINNGVDTYQLLHVNLLVGKLRSRGELCKQLVSNGVQTYNYNMLMCWWVRNGVWTDMPEIAQHFRKPTLEVLGCWLRGALAKACPDLICMITIHICKHDVQT